VDLTLAAVLAAVLLLSLLAVGALVLAHGPSDVVLLFLLVFALFAGLRPLLLVLGLDRPYPNFLFPPEGTTSAFVTTLLGSTLYLLLALAGIAMVTNSRVRGWGPFFARHPVDVRRIALVSYLLTGLSTLLSFYLLVRYGGVGGVVDAAKVDKALAGTYALRAVPAVAAVLSVAALIEVRRRSPGGAIMRSAVQLVLLGCALSDAFFVFLWGARSVLVVVGAMLILGLQPRRQRRRSPRERVLVRLSAAVVLVAVVASGMRMARDTLLQGSVEESFASASVWRQVSVGTNSIYFDAAMLSFRDWPGGHGFRGGRDFLNGVVGVVPRSVWSGKPATVTPGTWFRQVYDPHKRNGWPMGAPALWYLNFGWWGLPLGGLLSGFVIGLLAAAQRRCPRHGFNTGVALVAAVFVLPLGWDSQAPMKFCVWLLPLWLIGRYVCPPVVRSADPGFTHSGGSDGGELHEPRLQSAGRQGGLRG
jgi:hypothetical protein